mmetsp:Transcript_10884/g.16423  ORF Transcript_10884/g.16423 Transcript_10884/m.16423 type:complete len:219 (-) Transcript_10884:153-809(-)
MVSCCCPCHGVLIDGPKVGPRIRNYLSLGAGKESPLFSQGVLVFVHKGKALHQMGVKCQMKELRFDVLPQYSCDLVVLNLIEAKFLYDHGKLQIYDYWRVHSTIFSWFSARSMREDAHGAFARGLGILSAYKYFRKNGWFVDNIQANGDGIGSFNVRRPVGKSHAFPCMVLWSNQNTRAIHANMVEERAIAIIHRNSPESEPVVLWLDCSCTLFGKSD